MLLYLTAYYLLIASFTRHGYAPYCMVHYDTKVVNCVYATLNDCRNAYGSTNGARVCFASKDLPFKKFGRPDDK